MMQFCVWGAIGGSIGMLIFGFSAEAFICACIGTFVGLSIWDFGSRIRK
jgi:hypothetical protein